MMIIGSRFIEASRRMWSQKGQAVTPPAVGHHLVVRSSGLQNSGQ